MKLTRREMNRIRSKQQLRLYWPVQYLAPGSFVSCRRLRECSFMHLTADGSAFFKDWGPLIPIPQPKFFGVELTEPKVIRLADEMKWPASCTLSRLAGINVNCPRHNMGGVCCCRDNCDRHRDTFIKEWNERYPTHLFKENPWVWQFDVRLL